MIKKFHEFINEGLIQSVPIDKISKHLIQKVKLNPEDIWVDSGANGLSRINIEFHSKNADLLKEIHNKMTTVFGWFLSNVATHDLGEPYWENEWIEDAMKDLDETARLFKWHVEEYGDENEAVFVYEKKFDKKVNSIPSTLYHITEKDNADKIERQGLVAKSKSKKSIHPERIYLSLTKEAFKESGLSDHIGPSRDIVVFEIDNSNLNLKLHYDVNMKDAVYTTDNIPPNNLKRIDYDEIS